MEQFINEKLPTGYQKDWYSIPSSMIDGSYYFTLTPNQNSFISTTFIVSPVIHDLLDVNRGVRYSMSQNQSHQYYEINDMGRTDDIYITKTVVFKLFSDTIHINLTTF